MSFDKKTSVEYDGVEYTISTVRLPIQHHGDKYETCVFWDGGSRVTERYKTIDQAESGHSRHVKAFESGNVTVEDAKIPTVSIGEDE